MRFLFCSLESPGFLHPSVGMAQELVRRGHQAAFAADPETESLLRGAGLERLPRPGNDGPSFRTAHWAKPLAVIMQMRHVQEAIRRFTPDVLVAQALTFGPMLVSEMQQVPLAVIGLATYLWPRNSAELRAADASIAQKRRAWRFRDALKYYNAVRREVRLQPLQEDLRSLPFLGDLFLVRSVPELEGPETDLPPRVRLVGPCLWAPDEPPPAGLRDWLAETAEKRFPLFYVQHGRAFLTRSWWADLVAALDGARVRVAASTGRLDRPAGVLPRNFLALPHVSQEWVLNAARGVISGANSTAVLGALHAGIPSLLIPAGGEQPDVADRCAAVGAGRIVRPDEVTPELLREEADILRADVELHRCARALSVAMRRADAFGLAADTLESWAMDGSLPPTIRPSSGAPSVARN